MLNTIKTALRISHTYLDDEIKQTIKSAELELKRLGISDSAINMKDDLVKMAIKTYCLAYYSNNEAMAQGYRESFLIQADNLRNTTKYVQ